MDDEPTSYLALAGITLLYLQRGFNRWMAWKEKRRNGGTARTGSSGIVKSERGALGNGAKEIMERLDRIEARIGKIEVECGRLDERVKALRSS